MGRLAAPRDAVALDAERAEDDAEREVERLEDGPLLDMELEVRGGRHELGARIERAVEVDAVRCERVGERDAVAIGELPQLVLVGHRPCGGARPEEAASEARALLVGPVDETNGHGRSAFLRNAAEDLDAAHDVEGAVEPATVRDGVDVPAEQDRALGLPGEREPLVAGGVDLAPRPRRPPSFSRSQPRAVSHVSVHATRWAPSSFPVSSRSSSSSATVRAGSSGTPGA